MSAIGDYVHLTGRRYQLFGIGQYDGSPAFSYNYAEQKQKIKEKIQKYGRFTNKQGFENALNDIFNTRDSSQSATEVRNKIEKLLKQNFNKAMGKIDWDTGDIRKRLFQGKAITEKTIKLKANQKSIELRTIMQKIRSIEAIRNAIKNTMQADELTGRINSIYADLSLIITQIKTGTLSYLKDIRDIKNIQDRQLTLMGTSGENTLSLIKDINSILKTYGATPALDIQKSDMFDYAVALVPAVSKMKAGKELQQELSRIESDINARNEKMTVTITFDRDKFTNSLVSSELNFDTYAADDSTKTSISFGTAYNKSDITINWEGINLTASLKNTKIGKNNIQIMKSYPMLYLLQDENSDFVNHYLNTIATHIDGIQMSNISLAHEVMKYTAVFRALSDSITGDGSSIFIINDATTGKIRILNISDILAKLEYEIDNLSTVTIDNEEINSFRLKNYKELTWEIRITKLMNRLHAKKISVALSPALVR